MFKIKFIHEVCFVDRPEEARLKQRVKDLQHVIETALLLTQKLKKMDIEIEKLETEVSENTSATDSAIQLLTSLAQTIRDNAGNKAKMLELAGKLDANSNRLADAVTANTIQTEQPPVEGGGETGGGETGGGEVVEPTEGGTIQPGNEPVQ